MGETSDGIANHIDATRELLHENMQELERKVQAATNWREYIKRHPTIVTALAVGAGMLLIRRVTGKH